MIDPNASPSWEKGLEKERKANCSHCGSRDIVRQNEDLICKRCGEKITGGEYDADIKAS